MALLEMALCKLALAPLLLSVNNADAAVAHLCKITKTSHLIYGPRFEETCIEAQKILKDQGYHLELIPEKRFPLWGKGGVAEGGKIDYEPRLTPDEEAKRTAVILHTSGSVSNQ
jgi:hypothetical protein